MWEERKLLFSLNCTLGEGWGPGPLDSPQLGLPAASQLVPRCPDPQNWVPKLFRLSDPQGLPTLICCLVIWEQGRW